MRAKTILALLFVVSLGILGIGLLRVGPPQIAQVTTGVVAQPAPVPVREILAAAVSLPRGTLLRAQDVTWKAIAAVPDPDQIARPDAGERTRRPEADDKLIADLRGAALRIPIASGQAILRGDMVKPGDREFLQVVLQPGERAIAIPLPAGIGMLSPGDSVDVILTQTFHGDAPLTRKSVSETVAEDLRVLAIDPAFPITQRSLTLEVTPEQAEHINVAGELGKLSLTLRGGGGDPEDRRVRPAWAGDVSPALNGAAAPKPAVPAPVAAPTIEVIRGNHSEKVKPE